VLFSFLFLRKKFWKTFSQVNATLMSQFIQKNMVFYKFQDIEWPRWQEFWEDELHKQCLQIWIEFKRLLKFDQTIVDFGLFFTIFRAKHVHRFSVRDNPDHPGLYVNLNFNIENLKKSTTSTSKMSNLDK
jgi:hypothetical protein